MSCRDTEIFDVWYKRVWVSCFNDISFLPLCLSVFHQIFGARQNLKRLTLDLILKLMQGSAATLQHSGGQAAAGSAEWRNKPAP